MLYEPLQNRRQYNIRDQYGDCFLQANKLFWLPSFLLREDPDQRVIPPAELIEYMNNKEIAEPAEMNEELARKVKKYVDENYLILLMSGGDADVWLRKSFGGNV